MHRFSYRRILILMCILVVAFVAISQGGRRAVANAFGWPTASDPVTAAWSKARMAGSYHFTADVTQVTVPVANVTNVGRTSRTEQLHLEGQTDLRAKRLEMQLWSDGGSVLQNEGGIAFKSENGKTFTRRGSGEWQAADGFADTLAPQGDFLAYLHAMRDVQVHAPEERGPLGRGVKLTRYSFTFDGPAFAAYVRDQMTAALQARGELPPGMSLSANAYYEQMTGDGELWVDANGLPLRQILNLNFSEQRKQTVHAQIVVDFSRFGTPHLNIADGLRTGDFSALWQTLPGALPDPTPLGLLLAMLTFVIVVLYYRRVRIVYTGLVTALILSMVLGPVLTTLQIEGFFASQAAQAAAQTEQQTLAETRNAAVDLGRPAFNPQVNPLEATVDATRNAQHATGDYQSHNLSITQSPNRQTTDPNTNSDSDGLTDFVEERVGTEPTLADTDDDGINDDVEVMGFTLGGQRWYADALALDSNNDGLSDTQEWDSTGDGQPDDTDGDNTPDLFDTDNDNDGVPDRLDLAPFTLASNGFSEAAPLQLTLNNLTANKPTLVDFQLRPGDLNHLWYAFNVIDWPRDDKGQVQDVDSKTYADLAAAQGRSAGVNEAFGDLKLVPMLEIRINGAVTNLPPQAELTPYNIAVNNITADGSQKVIYVPLSVVTDEQTGQRVAFAARMKYLPGGTWPTPHAVRLAWVAQMLTDIPCDRTNPSDVAAGCATDNYIHNVSQVVQSYYDDFFLTGLNVTEEHGASTALIYEDPAIDPNLKDDVSLTALTLGLDQSFLTARDANNDQVRDIGIQQIADRFDHTSPTNNSAIWGLDGANNNLRVERYNYPTFDQAAIFTAMTDTVAILNSQFNGAWASDNTLKPTIAYAYEQQSRGLGLDTLKTGGGYMTLNGANLTVDMNAGSLPAPLITMVGLKWSHYCRANSSAAWAPCAGDDYWLELESRYGALPLTDEPTDPDTIAGSNAIMQVLNLALSQGINAVVQRDTVLVSSLYSLQTDSQIEADVRSGLNFGTAAVKKIANLIVMNYYLNNAAFKKRFGATVVDFLEGSRSRKVINSLKKTNRLKGTAIGITAAAIVTGISIGAYYAEQAAGNDLGGRIAIRSLVVAVQTYSSLVDPVLTVYRWYKSGQSIAALLRSSSTAAGVSRTAGAVGAVISGAIVWGFFIHSMVSNKVSAFSPDFNKALAETVAATIYIIIVALISATVVGLIIVGIVTVIDSILTAVCELGVDELRSDAFYGGACFTLGTTATKAIAYFLYNYDLMIDTNRTDLVAPGAPTSQLADPSKGFVAGNELAITMPITTHAVHKNPDPASGLYINFYLYYFSPDNLRSSTFRYSVTQPNPADITGISRGDMRGDWQHVGVDHKYVLTPMYGGYAVTNPPLTTKFNLQPGLNRQAAFYLNMGYAVPAYECWGIPLFPFYNVVIPVCYVRTFQGKTSTPINTLHYDIFPASVGGFMTLGAKSDNGRGLSWDAAFPSLRDGDGDGLLSNRFGGLDTNDSTWDSDGDGLGDAYEFERRAAGQPYSPIQADTDNDGLSDGQEAQIGSNPGIADSDNDGLKDSAEVAGWEVTINAPTPFTLRVTSDPTVADSDDDGLSDLAEYQLATAPDPAQRLDNQQRPYHPRVFNTPPIAVYTASNKAFVAPGQSLIYTTTVVAHAALAPSVLDVTVPSQLGASPSPYALAFDPLTFSTSQTVTQQTALSAQAGLNTQTLQLNSTVRARLAPTGPATLQWEPVSFQSLGDPGRPFTWLRVAGSSAERQDFYQTVTVASSSSTRSGDGAVLATTIPSGQSSTLFTSNASEKMGDTPPDVACNNAGICVAVWDSGVAQFHGVVIGANGQPVGNLTPDPATPRSAFNPQVASDGVNFLVVQESKIPIFNGGIPLIRWTLYNANGSVISADETAYLGRVMPLDQPGIGLDVAWIGSRYRVGWNIISNPGNYPLVNFGDIDQNGVLVNAGTPFQAVTALEPDNDADGTPALAYDPVGGRTLALFRGPNGDTAYILWPDTDLQNRTAAYLPNTDPTTNFRYLQSLRTPRVAYHPMLNGWLITARGRSDLFKPDLSTTLLPMQTVINNGDIPVACPVVATLPVLDLRFEDAPAPTGLPTTFGDSSGKGNNATCANCPTAGMPGAVDSSGIAIGGGAQGPASDYGVAFSGDVTQGLFIPTPVQNQFSFTFWYKSPASANQDSFWFDDAPGGGAFLSFNIFGAYLELKSGTTTLRADRNLNDGNWHFVAATRNNSSGQMAIYVDGNPTPAATVATSAQPFPRNPLLMRSRRPATIDHFRAYTQPLSGTTLQAIYNRTLQSYCVGVAGTKDNGSVRYAWTKLNASIPDTRGGKITASGGLTVTIDADKPTSTISGLSNGQYIRGNGVQTIGGNATDVTSGVAGVAVKVNGGSFQPASGAESWAYNLAVTEGAYTLQSRATDAVGNVETPAAAITVNADSTAPAVTLNALPATPIRLTRTGTNPWSATLSGTASDPTSGGVASGLPANGVEVRLQGQGDALGNGWQTATRNGNTWSINYTFVTGLPDPTGTYTVSVRGVDNVGNATADNAAGGLLHLDNSGSTATLRVTDAARTVISDTITISGIVTDTGAAGVDKLEVALVSVEQIAALPTDISADQADAQLNRTWLLATVAQRGAGVSSWSIQLPAGLEGEYQIDLRATDLLGNVLRSDSAWRGVIDTLAPRVVVTGSRSSYSWLDPNTGVPQYNLVFTCTATDRYLDETTFGCPANGATPVRTFDADLVLQALFPDRTIRNGLTVNAAYPSPDPNATINLRACDLYGHCANVSTPLTPATSAAVADSTGAAAGAAAAGEPQAIIVAPAEGNVVAANGALNVTVAAATGAAAGLKEVTITLDNNVVQTLTFAQSAAVTNTLRTVSLTGVSEGQHTLTARATDWANATQSTAFPVTFTLDAQPPVVTIDPTTLTNADTWQAGSGILRFNGTANDSIGLAAVQIREGDNAFSDAEFGNGTWQTALPVENPEGRTLTIVVRAIDRAGRISEVTQNIGTDLSTAPAPDTTILSGPANPSPVNSASFVFSGTVSATAYACQLDDSAFAPCVSPQGYSELSKGSHTFRVRAIDGEGNVDLTPAEFTWSVNASALDTTITAGPTNPTNSRDASFTFTGTGAAFDCALDDAAFTPCISPQSYSVLTYGDHSFLVRARNGSAVGAAARFVWMVVNAAPVANSQTVNTNENVAVAVTLSATDNDALTYQVRAPAHGVLLGVAPNLTYSPDSDFSGTDSFTFVVNDGQLTSNVATVTLNVATNNTDTTPPVITPQVTGTAGSNGWYVSDVSLTWTVVDGESPITSQTGCDPATVNTETVGQTFTCTATSRGGTATQSVTIKLDKTAPETTITAQPANPSTVATAAFQFSGIDNLSSVAGFACSLDNSAFAACTTPQTYNGLAEGSHTFQVRTIDGAGNGDATPAVYTWTVQSLTVVATCGPITVYRNAQGQLVAPGWVGTIKLGTAANNTINGGTGPDLILGLGGNDSLDGKAGDDLICGGDGVDLLTGAAGNDALDGGAGNDVLNSGAGDFDSLSGGEGNDILLDGDGVISALGGPGNDAFTLALRNGWRDRNGQARFTGLAAGYGNDTVGLAILNTVRFFIDITGDERDAPASPLEGTTDALVLAGLIDPASVIIKFERRGGVANGGIENEPAVDFTDFFVDPTTLTDESGATFLTEPVGGETVVEEAEQAVETRAQIYLPLIVAAAQ